VTLASCKYYQHLQRLHKANRMNKHYGQIKHCVLDKQDAHNRSKVYAFLSSKLRANMHWQAYSKNISKDRLFCNTWQHRESRWIMNVLSLLIRQENS